MAGDMEINQILDISARLIWKLVHQCPYNRFADKLKRCDSCSADFMTNGKPKIACWKEYIETLDEIGELFG